MKKILNRLNCQGGMKEADWELCKDGQGRPPSEVIFEQRFEASEGVSQVGIWVTRGCLKYLFY